MIPLMKTPNKSLARAIDAAGGLRALARELKTTHQNISQWKRVPAIWVLRVEKVTGVSRHDLRPDIYPREK